MAAVKFKVAAKTDVGIVRTNNEDNFQISWDLSSLPMRWVNNEVHQLSDKGCILVVADGMGGANAGEVASQIAIDTVKSRFIPDELTEKIISSPDAVNSFIKSTIALADNNIKKYAKEHPETKGMGTTIVIAWVIKDNLYIGWCGDSRAYIYNRAYGLVRLTKDHSYVQQLVDSGKLSEEEAFDFPDSNIITQCLSDASQKCHPETLARPIALSNNDTILLCTDGLCGMIRDAEISSIFQNSDDNLTNTADALVSAAISASGADNVTLCLFNVVGGLRKASAKAPKTNTNKLQKSYLIALAVLIMLIAAILWFFFANKRSQGIESSDTTELVSTDSISTNDITDPVKTIIDDSVTTDKSQSVEASDSGKSGDRQSGNGNNLLKGLNTVQIPKTEEKRLSEEEREAEILSTPEIIVVTLPPNKHIGTFCKEFGMTKTEFEKLNPEIKFEEVKAGDQINVYKKINKNDK